MSAKCRYVYKYKYISGKSSAFQCFFRKQSILYLLSLSLFFVVTIFGTTSFILCKMCVSFGSGMVKTWRRFETCTEHIINEIFSGIHSILFRLAWAAPCSRLSIQSNRVRIFSHLPFFPQFCKRFNWNHLEILCTVCMFILILFSVHITYKHSTIKLEISMFVFYFWLIREKKIGFMSASLKQGVCVYVCFYI